MQQFQRTKWACYTGNLGMAIVSNFPPLLFLTFRSVYGISYSLLGFLVLENFCTQLAVDLVFSFFSHKFNIPRVVKLTPVLTLIGFLVYGIWPWLFSDHVYVGLVIGTVLFSASSGLMEVLLSPVIAGIPAEDPDREMSKLHSVYAWGVVGVVIVSTLFLWGVGSENWQFLMLALTVVPITSALLFAGAEIPAMEPPEKTAGVLHLMKDKLLWLCVLGIFLGGASELVMAQWSSGYLERVLGIPKVLGDVFGVALFGLTLGLGRTLYANKGKDIYKALYWGAVGALGCYLMAVISPFAWLGLLSCGFTGFCVSMMWPGSLIVAAERFPAGGVVIYAMMAAGGDLGASVGPQLLGVVTDWVMSNAHFSCLKQILNLPPEQLGMKLGMLVGALFPLAGIFVYRALKKHKGVCDYGKQ